MLTNGPLVAELEDRLAERIGVRHVVAVSSCTSGMMLVAPSPHRGPGPRRHAELHVLRDRARGGVEQLHARLRRVFARDLPDRPGRTPRRVWKAPAALVATHVFGAPCDPRTVDGARRRRSTSRCCSTPPTRSARWPAARRSAASVPPRSSASRPPRCWSPAKAVWSPRTTTPSPSAFASAATTATRATTTRSSSG